MMELLITMAIASILVAVAIPSFKVISTNAARREASGSLYSAFQRARSEALARNATVEVCPANSAGSACDSASSYEKGWLVFRQGSDPSLADNVFQTHAEISPSIRMDGSSAISFNNNGRASATLVMSIYSASAPSTVRCLTVERSGRISLLEANPCRAL